MRLANVDVLTSFSWRIREALTAAGITRRPHGAEIDHIELFAPPSAEGNDSQNCPLSRQGLRSLTRWHRN